MRRGITLILLILATAIVVWSRQPGSAIGTLGSTYTVRPGDSLSRIAAEHNTTVAELVELNADRYPSLAVNPGLIEPGWVLTLPGRAGNEGTLWEQATTWLKGRVAPTVRAAGEKLASLPATPASGSGGTATSGGAAVPASGEIVVGDEAAENAILEMINQERARLGVGPLVMDEGLRASARERSRDMLARGYSSHYDPETGAPLNNGTWEVIAGPGRVTYGFSPAWRTWKQSPPHYAILTDGNLHRIGIGIARQGSWAIVTGQLLP